MPSNLSTGATSQAPSSISGTTGNNTSPNDGATQATSKAANKNKKKVREPRIDDITAIKMIFTGILFDLIALIPIIGGYGAEIVGGLTFLLWFLILGLPLMSPKTLANWVLNVPVGESISAGVWPGFTVGAIVTVSVTRFEDKTGIEVMAIAKKGNMDIRTALGKDASKQLQFSAINSLTPTGATSLVQQAQAINLSEKNPVTDLQEQHFADPSKPIPKGATPPPNKIQTRTTHHSPESNPQDEEVATGYTTPEENVSYYPDTYREDPFAFESPSEPPANDNHPKGPRRLPNRETAPFPGTSPQFGRSSKYEEQEVQRSDSGGKILTFDVNRKAPLQQDKADEIPKGATPVPKSVNDTVSSEE